MGRRTAYLQNFTAIKIDSGTNNLALTKEVSRGVHKLLRIHSLDRIAPTATKYLYSAMSFHSRHPLPLSSTPKDIREMGTGLKRKDFWDSLGGQALVMIGRWYSRQPLTSHK